MEGRKLNYGRCERKHFIALASLAAATDYLAFQSDAGNKVDIRKRRRSFVDVTPTPNHKITFRGVR